MANRYFVGTVSGSWNNANNWSATSGGSGGAGVPTRTSDVFLDSNSPNSTMDIPLSGGTPLYGGFKSLTCTGYTNTLTQNYDMLILGNVVLSSGMTYIHNNYKIAIYGNYSITSNGKTIGHLYLYQDQDADAPFTTTLLDNASLINLTIEWWQYFAPGTFNVTFTGTGNLTNRNGVAAITGTSTFIFDGTTTVVGNTRLYNTTINAGKSLVITSGDTLEASGTFNALGTISDPAVLKSSTATSEAIFLPTTVNTLSYINATDITSGSVSTITISNGILTRTKNWEKTAFLNKYGIISFKYKPFTLENTFILKDNVYKGNTHCHSNASLPGDPTPTALMTAMLNAGYHFSNISDYGLVTDGSGVEGILWVGGCESAPRDTGHINFFGVDTPPGGYNGNSQNWINNGLGQGAFITVNHPILAGYAWTNDMVDRISGYHGIEIESGSMGEANTFVDRVLSRGLKKYIVCSRDRGDTTHCIYVNADTCTKTELLTNMLAGNFYSSHGAIITSITAIGHEITCVVPVSSKIEWIVKNGVIKQTDNAVTTATFRVRNINDLYVRIRVTRASDNALAWSNPIWINEV